MSSISFDDSVKMFDQIISDMKHANEKNNSVFRSVSRQIFQKSFSKLESKQTVKSGVQLASVGLVSAIRYAQGKYRKDSFAKSFRKLHSQNNYVAYSDVKKINEFLNNSEFLSVTKLLKIHYNLGLKEALAAITK